LGAGQIIQSIYILEIDSSGSFDLMFKVLY
jgi:hypothetical protein